jgi:hypothetical protein
MSPSSSRDRVVLPFRALKTTGAGQARTGVDARPVDPVAASAVGLVLARRCVILEVFQGRPQRFGGGGPVERQALPLGEPLYDGRLPVRGHGAVA